MSIRQTLALSTAGAGLVTSNSFWFFDSSDSQPIQAAVNTEVQIVNPVSAPASEPIPSSQKPSTPVPSNVDINGLNPVPKHGNITGTTLKNPKLKLGTIYPTTGNNFTLDDGKGNKYMSKISTQLGGFALNNFQATEKNYLDFPKESIKISLFVKAAWYSTTEEDEYSSELEETQINELFKNQNEAKVKQLLLSLSRKLHWKKFHYSEYDSRTHYYSVLIYPRNLNDLENLKIKYFDNFESLKNYVHEKVKTCVGENISCVANPEELDIMDTDKMSFFEELKATQNAQ